MITTSSVRIGWVSTLVAVLVVAACGGDGGRPDGVFVTCQALCDVKGTEGCLSDEEKIQDCKTLCAAFINADEPCWKANEALSQCIIDEGENGACDPGDACMSEQEEQSIACGVGVLPDAGTPPPMDGGS